MTTRTGHGLAFLIAVAVFAAAPAPGLAGDRAFRRTDDDRHRGRDHHHHRDHRPTVLLRPVVPGPFFHHAPGARFGVVPPAVWYTPRTYTAPPVSYDYDTAGPVSPPPAYVPDGTVSIAPPGPNVIEYPNGRYELRGDGIWTPYTWVWVPNPPPAPPAAPPPAPPSAAPTPPEPRRQTELYRWKDEAGVVHWTDRWEAVPEQYRASVTKIKS
jgi:hypothetical protein